jgi:hypothetical protein
MRIGILGSGLMGGEASLVIRHDESRHCTPNRSQTDFFNTIDPFRLFGACGSNQHLADGDRGRQPTRSQPGSLLGGRRAESRQFLERRLEVGEPPLAELALPVSFELADGSNIRFNDLPSSFGEVDCGVPVLSFAAALQIAKLLELTEEMVQRLFRNAELLGQSGRPHAVYRRVLEQAEIRFVDIV